MKMIVKVIEKREITEVEYLHYEVNVPEWLTPGSDEYFDYIDSEYKYGNLEKTEPGEVIEVDIVGLEVL